MKVPQTIEASVTSMPWLPKLKLGAVYEFKGKRPLYQLSDGEMHEMPDATTTIFELVTLLDLDGTVRRGDHFTPAYRWTQADEGTADCFPDGTTRSSHRTRLSQSTRMSGL